MRKLFLLLAILFIFFSCRNLVQDEFPNFEKGITVNSVLVVGDTLKAHVSLADKLDTSRLGFIDNAMIALYADNEFLGNMTYTDSGRYTSDIIVETQKEYVCKVTVPGYEEVVCSQILPNSPVITKIEHINIAGKDEEGTTYPAVKISFKNNPDIATYYEIELRNILIFMEDTTISIADVIQIVDPVILNEGLPIALFSNELISDSTYTLTLNYTTHQASSRGGAFRTTLFPLVVELRKVSYDYYRFKKQVYLYEQGRSADGITTSMTNANLYSNVKNGYGIFAGYSSCVSDTITPNLDRYYE